MKKVTWMSLLMVFSMRSALVLAASISNLEFKFGEGQSNLEISTDGPISFEKVESLPDQVVIDLKDTKVLPKFARKTDASQFKSNLSLFSAYQKGDDARVVLQLKNQGNVHVTQDGNKIVASIENEASGEVAAESSESTAESAEAAPSANDSTAENIETPAEEPVAKEEPTKDSAPTAPTVQASNKTADPDGIESFMEAQETKKFVGSKISIQMQNADLQDIFRVIANASEFNIILSDKVTGKMSLDLSDVPWDQVLDIVLRTNRLSAERVANILRVLPTEDLQREKDIEVQAKVSAEIAEPLVSKIFPLSYATTEDVQKILTSYLSKDPRTNAVRGSIDVDRRSNSLVVRETPTTIEKFKRLIKELDTQTPQVLVEGKFVEVAEDYTHILTGQLMGHSQANNNGSFAFSPSSNNYYTLFNQGGIGTTALGSILPGSNGVALGFAPKAGLLPGIPNLSALLSISENTEKVKTVASPRVVTQNRMRATISQGFSATFLTNAGLGASGGISTINFNLNLAVEPQVTNDGSINLKINFSQSSPRAVPGVQGAQASSSTKSVDTLVLVESGATIVIGGIYQTNITESRAGIPLLMDLPIIGAFFGSKSNTENKTELFIFLTPRIINEKEAGLRT